MHSMQHNSEQLSPHLKNILSLSNEDTSTAAFNDEVDIYKPMHNAEILEYATHNDLPIFVSIDGSWMMAIPQLVLVL